jgi:hypothetical protein
MPRNCSRNKARCQMTGSGTDFSVCEVLRTKSRFFKTHTPCGSSGSCFQLLAFASPRPRRNSRHPEYPRFVFQRLCCGTTSSFSKSSSTFLRLLFRLYVVPPVFASSLRTRSSEREYVCFWYFCPSPTLAIPILSSKQIPLEL